MDKQFFWPAFDPNSALSNKTYTDGSPLNYDVSYPVMIVIIHVWENVGLITQNLIRTQLTAQRFIEQ